MNTTSSTIPKMSPEKLISNMTLAYSTVINNKSPLSTIPALMLWGPPGVGKSQAIHKIAHNLHESTGKTTRVTDVRLMLFNPIDLRGIPTSNHDKTLAIWLKPQIFHMDESEDVINILFLDEISSAPQSVQAAAYQITLDRTIGEHKLPDNCIVVAAGNRTSDKSVASKMPRALANRLMHIEIETSFDSWRRWAIANGIHEKVIGFLSFRRGYLMDINADENDLAFATPRTWEMVSNILNGVSDDINTIYQFVSALVGTGISFEFRNWCSIYEELPDIEEIFAGKEAYIPENTDVICAMICAMTAYASKHRDNMEKIANSIKYMQALPAEFFTLLMRDYMSIEPGYKHKLRVIPEFDEWISSKEGLFDEFE